MPVRQNKPTKQTKKAKKKNVRRAQAELLCVVAAFILLSAVTVAAAFFPEFVTAAGISATVLYVAVAAVIFIPGKMKSLAAEDSEAVSPYLGDIMTDVMTNISLPSAICSEGGIIIWHNNNFAELADTLGRHGRLRGAQFSSVMPIEFDEISAGGSIVPVKAEEIVANIESSRFRVNGRQFFILIIHDMTETESLRARIEEDHPLVAHIQVDNLGELAQLETGEYRDAGRDVDTILKDWARSIGAVLREYDTSKYIMLFSQKFLDEFTARKFDVLDRVREVRVGAGMLPVTVSIGISTLGETLHDNERASFAALNTALQRGGDQVVLESKDGTEFYGGKTKTTQRRTKVRSRVIANELSALIARSGNVLIMGHRYPDFDSIGSCIGAASFARRQGANVHIIVDVDDANIAPCIGHVQTLPEYRETFVDEQTALDMIRSDTLVIVCDVNSVTHLSAPSVANSAPKIAVIDHHIKTEQTPNHVLLSYIEPSASSACELVSDMIEQVYQSNGVLAAEADVMYAGILLDTKQLSRSTTPRTFSAAMYLQSCGANPETAVDFFRSGIDDFMSEARFESNVTIYRSEIAIAASSEPGEARDRIAAAKAADKLLTVKGVTAAFTAVRIGDIVHISARSSGSINVQLITEKLGGGGHFDVAGAQLKNSELDTALRNLKDAIDNYFSEQ